MIIKVQTNEMDECIANCRNKEETELRDALIIHLLNCQWEEAEICHEALKLLLKRGNNG